jgi:two-component system nitrogen regulation response regulator NtrX
MTAPDADILIVDDEPDIRGLIAGILADEGYKTREADSADAARAAIADKVPDAMILDIWLKDNSQDGLMLLDEISPAHPHLPVIMISGHGTIEMAVQAIRQGAYDFIEKPFKTERLLLMLARALETLKLRKENAALRRATSGRKVSDLIGNSQAAQQLRSVIGKVASSSSRVLLTGEAGSGKETVGRLIHAQSPRADQPFLVLNCNSLNPERQEVELFGGDTTLGLLQQADGGTVYLDEVADMPVPLQTRMLRFLQDGLIQPVGGGASQPVDVRIIAATSRDLEAAIKAGTFKADFYYRLNVVPLKIPPLRERIADIGELFADFLSQQLGKALTAKDALAPSAAAILETYGWPGNVRELRNMAEWIAIMQGGAPGLPLSDDALPPSLTNPDATGESGGSGFLNLPLREARERFEQDYLKAQLQRFQGNMSQTAKFVGMERSALHRKMKTLGGEGGDA